MFQVLKKKSKDLGIRSHLTVLYFKLTIFIIDTRYYPLLYYRHHQIMLY